MKINFLLINLAAARFGSDFGGARRNEPRLDTNLPSINDDPSDELGEVDDILNGDNEDEVVVSCQIGPDCPFDYMCNVDDIKTGKSETGFCQSCEWFPTDAECNAAGFHAYESFSDCLEECAGIAPTTAITTTSFPDHWNTKYCVDEGNTLPHVMKQNQLSFSRKGGNAVVLRAKVPKVSETQAYTMFIAWNQKQCGEEFMLALEDNFVQVNIIDQSLGKNDKPLFKEVGFPFMGGEGKGTNVIFQYSVKPCLNMKKCLGNKKQDEFEVIVTGFKDVDFGNKEWAKCLKGGQVGYLGTNGNPELTQEHVAPCISWFQGADWINNFA